MTNLLAGFSWGSPEWWLAAACAGVVLFALVLWNYSRIPSMTGVKLAAATCKSLGILLLLLCLLEPLWTQSRAEPGANTFVILADGSLSLTIRDEDSDQHRGDRMKQALTEDADWRTRLGQDFDLRQYVFATQVEAVDDFEQLTFAGDNTSTFATLQGIQRRLTDRSVTGILLMSDGINSVSESQIQELVDAGLPPVFPVIQGEADSLLDLSIDRVSVSQTNFEDAPVSVNVEFTGRGFATQDVVCRVLNSDDDEVQRKSLACAADGSPNAVRLTFKPPAGPVHFYRVQISQADQLTQFKDRANSQEATLVNNERLICIRRPKDKHRVLYVSGRPNWEYKFLRRSLESDEELQLVGLIRIAKREPKFNFRSRAGESTNPLFRGFGNEEDDTAEQYDEPVLLRLGTEDKTELAGGFPKTADELFQFDAIILDDVEAQFFSQDQRTLIREFVSRRGGGFMMLGGIDSLDRGDYRHSGLEDILPVYLDGKTIAKQPTSYKLSLTRDGWLQPWIRLRPNQTEERKRLNEMPEFQTLGKIGRVKPGASVLAEVSDANGNKSPAVAVQRFGKGRSAVVALGDLWRWGMKRKDEDPRDLERAWRQTVRWLVADVQGRLNVQLKQYDQSNSKVSLNVQVHDDNFTPLDNAEISIQLTLPDQTNVDLTATPDESLPGVYNVTHLSKQPGPHLAVVTAAADDGSVIDSRKIGWNYQPSVAEFQTVVPNVDTMTKLAKATGGEVVALNELDAFANELPNRKSPVMATVSAPLWHQYWIFLLAVGLLVTEWALRRTKGLP